MIAIPQKEKERLMLADDLTKYIHEKHTQDECIGFTDGYKAAIAKVTSIKKVKDSWSREEVIKYSYWLRNTDFNIEGHSPEDCLSEWIEQNL